MGPSESSPASRQTWTDAVAHIIWRPHGPPRSKNASMAAYRGRSSTRRGGRSGSRPNPGELKAGGGERRAQRGEVGGGGADQVGQRIRGQRAELKLPAGSVVSSAPDGSTPGASLSEAGPAGLSGSSVPDPVSAPKAATAAAIRPAGTGRAGSRASRTSHSSSTPTRRGGPVFRQMPWICSAACSSAHNRHAATITRVTDNTAIGIGAGPPRGSVRDTA